MAIAVSPCVVDMVAPSATVAIAAGFPPATKAEFVAAVAAVACPTPAVVVDAAVADPVDICYRKIFVQRVTIFYTLTQPPKCTKTNQRNKEWDPLLLSNWQFPVIFYHISLRA